LLGSDLRAWRREGGVSMRSTRFRLHVGIEGETGKGDGKGTRGGGKESGCMSPQWVGSDAFLLVPFLIPFPSRANSTRPRRATGQQHATSLPLFQKSHSICASMYSTTTNTNHPSNHPQRTQAHDPQQFSSATTFSFQGGQEAASSCPEGRWSHNQVLVE
jgi:hypothetical protein